jgi:hypothetical protein
MQFLRYKQKKLPYKVGYYALKHYEEETGKPSDQIGSGGLKDFEILLYYALQAGHRDEGRVFEIDRSEMEWILDECFMDFVQNVKMEEGAEKKTKAPVKAKPSTK